jgi:hypothetical protein
MINTTLSVGAWNGGAAVVTHVTADASVLSTCAICTADHPGEEIGEEGPLEDINSSHGGISWFKGVYRATGRNVRRSLITFEGKTQFLGNFKSEEEAARKYDEAAASLGRTLNFPGDGHLQAVESDLWRPALEEGQTAVLQAPQAPPSTFRFEARQGDNASPLGSARYRGVSWHPHSSTWRAAIFIDGELTRLGSFDTEDEAAHRYDYAAAPLGRPLNFRSEGQPDLLFEAGVQQVFCACRRPEFGAMVRQQSFDTFIWHSTPFHCCFLTLLLILVC